MKKFFLSLIIIFVLGGDFLALAAEIAILGPLPLLNYKENDKDSTLAFHLFSLPGQLEITVPKVLFCFFYAGGVFNAAATFNLDYAIYALPSGAKAGAAWVDIDCVRQCFPYPLGETFLRFDLAWHKLLGDESYTAALKNLVVKIREKYNREHPDRTVQKVAIYMRWWPRSEKSYYELRNPSYTHWLLLTSEK